MKTGTDTITTYLRRNYITDDQAHAAGLFAADFRARYPGVRTRRLEPGVQHRGTSDLFDMRGVAASRAGQAIAALGPLKHITLAVTVFDQPASTWLEEQGGKATDALPLLRAGLDVLVRFYGLSTGDVA